MPDERRATNPAPHEDADLAHGWDAATAVNALLSLASLAIILIGFWRLHQVAKSAGNAATAPPANAPPPPHPLDLLALVWLWWFFAYLDTWEHHYVMLLPLAALLGMTGRLRGSALWIPALLWALPSLWVVAGPAVDAHATDSRLWVLLYYLQRPVGVLWVFAVLGARVLGKALPPDAARDSQVTPPE